MRDWLAKWEDEQLDYFNVFRARHYSVKKALEKVLEVTEAYEYSYVNVAAYARSTQGQKDLQASYDVVRERAKELSYSHSGSRLDTLIEVADKLLLLFRGTVNVQHVTKLAGELRDVLKEIRLEVDPYGMEDGTVKSHFETILTGMAGLPANQRNMILGATESTSTLEVANN